MGTKGWRSDVQLPGAEDVAKTMKRVFMTVAWADLTPDGLLSTRRVVTLSNGSHDTTAAHLYAAHTNSSIVVYSLSRQGFTLNASFLGNSNLAEISVYDPSAGSQSRSSAFPVKKLLLHASKGGFEVPPAPWEGDAVVVARHKEMRLKHDDATRDGRRE